eukprot:1141678-Pelagomonas_calceolata.AAC.5
MEKDMTSIHPANGHAEKAGQSPTFVLIIAHGQAAHFMTVKKDVTNIQTANGHAGNAGRRPHFCACHSTWASCKFHGNGRKT